MSAHDVPGPGDGALGGNDHAYQRDRVGFLRRCQQQYGDVFRFDRDMVMVCDPKLARCLLDDADDRLRAETTLLPDLRMASHTARAEWMHARQVIDHGLTGPVLAGHATRLVALLGALLPPLAGRTLPGVSTLQRLAAATTADFCVAGSGTDDPATPGAPAEAAAGATFPPATADTGGTFPGATVATSRPAGGEAGVPGPDSHGAPGRAGSGRPDEEGAASVAEVPGGRHGAGAVGFADAIGESALALIAVLDRGLRLPRWIPDPRRRRLRVADRALSAAIARVVGERIGRPVADPPADLLDLVLADGADRASAARALATTLAGSLAVPGTALTWTLAVLAEHPEAYRRVRAEAAERLADAVAAGDPDRLPYTAAVVREVLRLHPPTWLLGRQVTEPLEVGGWSLAAGERMVFSPYLIHRDPRCWSDPDDFRPERFDTGAPPAGYLPFGAGPRGCLGARLALLQLTVTAAVVARDHDLRCTPHPVRPRFSTLLAPTELRLHLTPRPAD